MLTPENTVAVIFGDSFESRALEQLLRSNTPDGGRAFHLTTHIKAAAAWENDRERIGRHFKRD